MKTNNQENKCMEYIEKDASEVSGLSRQNVQALAPAVAGTALQNSEQNSEATAGCQQRSCSGLGDALSSLHRLWLNWDDVSAINGVNTYGTDEKECEIEVVFKSGKSVKVKLGEMIGIKTLSECPLAKQKPSDN